MMAGPQFVEEDVVNVTDVIEVYEKGKVFACPECGQDMGVEHDVKWMKCPSCGSLLEDEKSEIRSEMDKVDEVEDGQSELADFM